MRRVATFFACLLLAAWLPATLHCTLESFPAFAFLQSCCGDDDGHGHRKEACATPGDEEGGDACSVVESGLYRSSHDRLSLPALADPIDVPASDLALTLFPKVGGRSEMDVREGGPPEGVLPVLLAVSWHFLGRAALPPRAPSLTA